MPCHNVSRHNDSRIIICCIITATLTLNHKKHLILDSSNIIQCHNISCHNVSHIIIYAASSHDLDLDHKKHLIPESACDTNIHAGIICHNTSCHNYSRIIIICYIIIVTLTSDHKKHLIPDNACDIYTCSITMSRVTLQTCNIIIIKKSTSFILRKFMQESIPNKEGFYASDIMITQWTFRSLYIQLRNGVHTITCLIATCIGLCVCHTIAIITYKACLVKL